MAERVRRLLAGLSARERLLVVAALAIGATAALFIGVVEPLSAARHETAARLADRIELLEWISTRAAEAKALHESLGDGGTGTATGAVGIAEVEASVSARGLRPALTRLTPQPGGAVRGAVRRCLLHDSCRLDRRKQPSLEGHRHQHRHRGDRSPRSRGRGILGRHAERRAAVMRWRRFAGAAALSRGVRGGDGGAGTAGARAAGPRHEHATRPDDLRPPKPPRRPWRARCSGSRTTTQSSPGATSVSRLRPFGPVYRVHLAGQGYAGRGLVGMTALSNRLLVTDVRLNLALAHLHEAPRRATYEPLGRVLVTLDRIEADVQPWRIDGLAGRARWTGGSECAGSGDRARGHRRRAHGPRARPDPCRDHQSRGRSGNLGNVDARCGREPGGGPPARAAVRRPRCVGPCPRRPRHA